MKKFNFSIANCGKFICNVFGWDAEKIGVITVKVPFDKLISKDGLIENFFCMRGGRKFVVDEV